MKNAERLDRIPAWLAYAFLLAGPPVLYILISVAV
jgi:hypothetical protein